MDEDRDCSDDNDELQTTRVMATVCVTISRKQEEELEALR